MSAVCLFICHQEKKMKRNSQTRQSPVSVSSKARPALTAGAIASAWPQVAIQVKSMYILKKER